VKLPWSKPKILPELVGLSVMKGHSIVPCDKNMLYSDTIYSTTVVCKGGNKDVLLNGIFYSDELENRGWIGASDTIRNDVKRGEYGGSFEDKSFFIGVDNNANIEIALTSEFQNYPNGQAIFIFEAYKVTPET